MGTPTPPARRQQGSQRKARQSTGPPSPSRHLHGGRAPSPTGNSRRPEKGLGLCTNHPQSALKRLRFALTCLALAEELLPRRGLPGSPPPAHCHPGTPRPTAPHAAGARRACPRQPSPPRTHVPPAESPRWPLPSAGARCRRSRCGVRDLVLERNGLQAGETKRGKPSYLVRASRLCR